MWKSVLTRLSQSRSLTTSSHNFTDYKGASFSNADFERKRQRYVKKDDFDYPKRNDNSRDYKKNSDGYPQRYNSNSGSRHTSFNADDEDSWEDRPAHKNRYSNNRDTYTSRFRSQEREDYGEERNQGNANLSEIGVPSKWKVGNHFVKESDRLREIQNKCRGDFKKMASFTVKRNPGIRRQVEALGEFANQNEFAREEDFDDEVNVNKFDKMYDEAQSKKQEIKELVKMKMVKQKYFKDAVEGKTLSWSDKEHIRFLHNSDPQQWTFEMIAEHFRIEPQVAKAIATAKWIPKKTKSEELNLSNPIEIHPLANVVEEQQEITRTSTHPSKSRMFKENQRVTLQELKKDMGVTEESIVKNNFKSTEIDLEPEDVSVDKDLVLQYLSSKSPPKWSSQESTHSERKVLDEADLKIVQFSEDRDSQQHSRILTKTENGENTDSIYQKGDSFYTADGELLYRVPNLSK
ncbi:neugrin-like isoform X2 [Daphnia pulicaria]|uniref:neugrin-like isoform X2 n=1 Tax=Daphnia pulicaria TaxID=35523 RepID=UPI001EECCA34|nr:neugrin-like isoform X2 [Daphnia pulicaria]